MHLRSRTKKVIFIFLAVCFGLLLTELVAQVAEIIHPPKPVEARSPLEYQHILDSEPVETCSLGKGKTDRYIATWAERPCEWVYKEKLPNEKRVVFLGGSAVLGVGYSLTATLTQVAERLLRRAYPDIEFRIINLAHIGYASPQLAYINEHLLPFLQPDLVVTVLGNNEFRDVFAFAQNFSGHSIPVKRWIVARWLERHLALARWARPKMKLKKLTLKEKNNFPKLKFRDDLWEFVYARLQRSIKKIVRDTHGQGANLMICSVPVNRRFRLPRKWFFAEEPNTGYPDQFRRANWAMSYGSPELAADYMQKRLAEKQDDIAARLILARAQKMLGKHDLAAKNFGLVKEKTAHLLENEPLFEFQVMHCEAVCQSEGKRECDEATLKWITQKSLEGDQYIDQWEAGTLASIAGDVQSAREFFGRSLKNNPGKSRASDKINHILLSSASGINGVGSFDLAKEVEKYSEQGIPGFDLFIDYCHYNAKGHIVLGHILAGQISKAFQLPDKLPSVRHGVSEYLKRRTGRLSDLPDYNDWVGVDFDVPRLVEQKLLTILQMESLTQQYMEKNGQSALSKAFQGNWALAYQGCWDKAKAKALYEDALKLAPDFIPAKENLKILETLNQEY